MPEETYNTIIGNTGTPAGKEVKGVDPVLVQQDAPETMQEAGKAATGVAPELRQQKVESVTPAAGLPTQQQNQVQVPAQQPAAKPEPKHLSYVEMMQMAYPYQAPSPEEVEKERKREKNAKMWAAIGDAVAAMADIYFAGKTGYSNYRPGSSMSAKVNARADQLRKEREANRKQYFQLYMQAKAHDDANQQAADRLNLQKQSAEQQRQQWEAQFKRQTERDAIADERYKAEQDFQREKWEDQKKRADKQQEDADRKFKESVRQFNVSSSQSQQRINDDKAKNTYTFFVGEETLAVPKDALNAETISAVFSALPPEVQQAARNTLGEPIMDSRKKKQTGTKPLTAEQMLTAIGAAINAPDAQDAQYLLRILAGQKGIEKPKKEEKPADEWAGVDEGKAQDEWSGVK